MNVTRPTIYRIEWEFNGTRYPRSRTVVTGTLGGGFTRPLVEPASGLGMPLDPTATEMKRLLASIGTGRVRMRDEGEYGPLVDLADIPPAVVTAVERHLRAYRPPRVRKRSTP